MDFWLLWKGWLLRARAQQCQVRGNHKPIATIWYHNQFYHLDVSLHCSASQVSLPRKVRRKAQNSKSATHEKQLQRISLNKSRKILSFLVVYKTLPTVFPSYNIHPKCNENHHSLLLLRNRQAVAFFLFLSHLSCTLSICNETDSPRKMRKKYWVGVRGRL